MMIFHTIPYSNARGNVWTLNMARWSVRIGIATLRTGNLLGVEYGPQWKVEKGILRDPWRAFVLVMFWIAGIRLSVGERQQVM